MKLIAITPRRLGKTTAEIARLTRDFAKFRAQVTQLQIYNNEQVERRRAAEGKLRQQERLDKLCAQALDKWGDASQLDMCAEECAELIVAIQHLRRGRPGATEAVFEEAADAYITIMQVRLLDPVAFAANLAEKLDRLEKLLDEAQNAAAKISPCYCGWCKDCLDRMEAFA